jgi:hypothetical protein
MKNCNKETKQASNPKKPVKKQQDPADPVKELAKAQRKIKKLQKQADMYYAWFKDERIERNKATQACNESQYVAKLFKEQCEDFTARYEKLLEENIAEQKKKLHDTLDNLNTRLKSVNPAPVKKVSISKEKNFRLLCINTGPIEYQHFDGDVTTYSGDAVPLEFCEVYTSPGPLIDEWGVIAYPINEFDSIEMLAQRFVVLQETA